MSYLRGRKLPVRYSYSYGSGSCAAPGRERAQSINARGLSTGGIAVQLVSCGQLK